MEGAWETDRVLMKLLDRCGCVGSGFGKQVGVLGAWKMSGRGCKESWRVQRVEIK